MPKAKAMKAAKNEAGAEKEDSAAGVRITHPDRVLWPDVDVTKRDLVDYYLKVAKLMLPHVKGRPLALVRTPDGVKGERFFQKHASKGWPDAFKPIRIREKSGSDEYMYIEDEAGLVAAAQMSVVELHILDFLADDVEHPDRLVFDLDPDEEIPFKQVIAAANDMRKRLAKLGLKSFPMVTGGKGIHVVVPLKRGHSWDEHRDFAEALARLMAEEEPDRYIAVMSKAKRRGKIFIDYLRNQRGSTAIAPYSSRAKDSASIALPVSWPALGKLKNAQPAHVDDTAAAERSVEGLLPGEAETAARIARRTTGFQLGRDRVVLTYPSDQQLPSNGQHDWADKKTDDPICKSATDGADKDHQHWGL